MCVFVGFVCVVFRFVCVLSGGGGGGRDVDAIDVVVGKTRKTSFQ